MIPTQCILILVHQGPETGPLYVSSEAARSKTNYSPMQQSIQYASSCSAHALTGPVSKMISQKFSSLLAVLLSIQLYIPWQIQLCWPHYVLTLHFAHKRDAYEMQA